MVVDSSRGGYGGDEDEEVEYFQYHYALAFIIIKIKGLSQMIKSFTMLNLSDYFHPLINLT